MILVTGGTGLLGSHLLYELARMGRKIRAIKRNTSDTSMVRRVFAYYCANPDELLKNIEWFDADLIDFGAIDDAFDGIREVYHVGAVVSFYPKDHKSMLKVNIEGTANLVNFAIEKGVQKFCYVSSVATLGRGGNGIPTNEEDFWVPSRRNTIYSISKYGAERGTERGDRKSFIHPRTGILGRQFQAVQTCMGRTEILYRYRKRIRGCA
jgi:dihydroflavonol-4-reductase